MRLKQFLPFLLAALMGVLGIQLLWQTPVSADPQLDSCASPDISGGNDLVGTDTVWTDEIYVGTNFTIRGNSTLTIEAGTRVIFCGDYSVSIGGLFSPAQLMALGTAEEPIVFETATGVPQWGTLYFGDSMPEISVLQHVEFRDGGSGGNTAAAVTISERHAIITQTSPIIDQVSIIDSVGYGLSIDMNTDNDPTPPAISNLTITGSAKNPIYTVGSGVSALNGPLTLTGNMTQTIEVHGFAMYFNQVWRDHGVPYHIDETIRMRNEDPFQPFSTWHIEPGVNILMGPFAYLNIDGDARIDWQGTADDPIVIKQNDEGGDPWGEVFLATSEPGPNKMAYVELINGGGANSLATATINNPFGGTLKLDYVTVIGSQNAGLHNSRGFNATNSYTVNQSHFEGNRVGIQHSSGNGVIRNTAFINNFEYGIENLNPQDYCVDAGGNYWGNSSGPADTTTVGGQCNDEGVTNAGTGNASSDGVLYFPWLTDSDTGIVTDHSSLSVGDKLWIIANGVDSAPVELTLRNANGDPIAGKQIEFRTSRGEFSAATGTTNSSGKLTTNITSTVTGNAEITAFNVTDNVPVAARLSVFFWQGSSDTGGLVDQTGAPYASPELVVEGEPFEAGLPIVFKLPMQNTQSSALQVDVTYKVQGFGIASGSEVVGTPSALLQPGDTWDALGGFTPADTGHRCVVFDV
ncbi:MAG: Ig-like domain-containing protein, partial [Chloroflexota bacterium]